MYMFVILLSQDFSFFISFITVKTRERESAFSQVSLNRFLHTVNFILIDDHSQINACYLIKAPYLIDAAMTITPKH